MKGEPELMTHVVAELDPTGRMGAKTAGAILKDRSTPEYATAAQIFDGRPEVRKHLCRQRRKVRTEKPIAGDSGSKNLKEREGRISLT